MSKTTTTQIKRFKTFYDNEKMEGLSFPEPTLTEQHHINDTNINEIVSNYTQQDIIEHFNANNIPEQYGEFINFDYSDSMDKMSKIKEDFESLPSSERLQYENDPQYWYNSQVKQLLTNAMETGDPISPDVVEVVADVPKSEQQTPTVVGGA